ncbi:hypothetical protein ACFY7C_18860 [Streptomyces sp. NPDC012769]|uniref:hypothetical protein n=1 Tax=Streptomyces sp. NPDC012769 TaxID=3364848 RepID=UPI00368084F5
MGTAVLLAAAPAGRGRAMDAASVLPALAAVPAGVLAGTDMATVVELADPLDPQAVLTRLRSAAAAPGPLALYLAGQLQLDRRQRLPHLALARSTPTTLRYTGLPWHWLATELAPRRPGTTTVVADLAADPELWQRLAADPGALDLGPAVPLFARVTPFPRRGALTTPEYLRHFATLWRTGARPPLPALHAEAAAAAAQSTPQTQAVLLTPPAASHQPTPFAAPVVSVASSALVESPPTRRLGTAAPARARDGGGLNGAPSWDPRTAAETGPVAAPVTPRPDTPVGPARGENDTTAAAPAPAGPATTPVPATTGTDVPPAAPSEADSAVEVSARGRAEMAGTPRGGGSPFLAGSVAAARWQVAETGAGAAIASPQPGGAVRPPRDGLVPAAAEADGDGSPPTGPSAAETQPVTPDGVPSVVAPREARDASAPHSEPRPAPSDPGTSDPGSAPAVTGPGAASPPPAGGGTGTGSVTPESPAAPAETDTGSVPPESPAAPAETDTGSVTPESPAALAETDTGLVPPGIAFLPAAGGTGVVPPGGASAPSVTDVPGLRPTPAETGPGVASPPAVGGRGVVPPGGSSAASGTAASASPAASAEGLVPSGAASPPAVGGRGVVPPGGSSSPSGTAPSEPRPAPSGTGTGSVPPESPAASTGTGTGLVSSGAASRPSVGGTGGVTATSEPRPAPSDTGIGLASPGIASPPSVGGTGVVTAASDTGTGTGTGTAAGVAAPEPTPVTVPPRPTHAPGPPRPGGGVDPHQAILAAAMAGRHGEAAAVAAAWESDALRRYGPRSGEAVHWVEVRADLARLAGEPARSCELWIAAAQARLGMRQGPDEPDVEGAVDRAHHQWEQIRDPARARALGPALVELRRAVPGRRAGALAALQRRMG